MRRTLPKKAGLVALASIAIVAVFVATAFAAPVLQPGVTSAPGMSGVCTNCHTYAKPPVVTPPVVTPPTVTPPVVTPPTTTPGAGEGREKEGSDDHVAKKVVHKKKHHHRKAVRHHRERD